MGLGGVRLEGALKVGDDDGGGAVEDTGERAHRGGEETGDDHADDAGRELVGDKEREDGIVGQAGGEAIGVRAVESPEGGADKEKEDGAADADEVAEDDGTAGFGFFWILMLHIVADVFKRQWPIGLSKQRNKIQHPLCRIDNGLRG